jgi:hypothetical protein
MILFDIEVDHDRVIKSKGPLFTGLLGDEG